MTLLKCWAFLSSSQGTNGPRVESGRERGLCTPMTPSRLSPERSISKVGDLGSVHGLGRSPEGGHGNPLHYSCRENPHGLRSLVGYCSWGCKESNMTETKHMTPIAVEQKFSAGKHRSFHGKCPAQPRNYRSGVNTCTESREASAVCLLQMPSPLSGTCMGTLGPLCVIFQG